MYSERNLCQLYIVPWQIADTKPTCWYRYTYREQNRTGLYSQKYKMYPDSTSQCNSKSWIRYCQAVIQESCIIALQTSAGILNQ